MKNSRLFTTFQKLPKEEIRQLKDFIDSPFFNKREHLCRLLDYLCRTVAGKQKQPDKKEAYRYVFPGTPYKDPRMRLAMSDLYKLIEQFLTLRSLLEDEANGRIHLARSFRRLDLPKHAQRTRRDASRALEAQPYRNADYYNNKYLLQWEEYQHLSASQRSTELNLQEISDTTDIAFLTLKLRQSCYSLSHQAVYRTRYRLGLLNEALQYIEQQNLLHIPAISVYYYCYHTLVHPGREEYFREFKSLLFECGDKFPAAEIRDIYLLAINYCIKRLNEGHEQYCREGLDLYRQGLERNILLDNDKLSRFTYNNIVAMGLRSKEYEWTEQFIFRYKSALERQFRESAFAFNLARLKYEKKDLINALALLQKAEYKDLLNNLITKTLMMKIYYESGEWQLLQSHLDAMRIFLRRKKVMGYHKTNYRNIIYFTQKLISINPFEKEKLKELKRDIRQEEVITEREWLLKQLEK